MGHPVHQLCYATRRDGQFKLILQLELLCPRAGPDRDGDGERRRGGQRGEGVFGGDSQEGEQILQIMGHYFMIGKYLF